MIASLYVGLEVSRTKPLTSLGQPDKNELRRILDSAYEGYTMTDCDGRWQCESEPSVRVDLLVNLNEPTTVQHLFIVVGDICEKLRQDCVMMVCRSEAHFESGKGPYVDRVDWLNSLGAAVPADWGMELDGPDEPYLRPIDNPNRKPTDPIEYEAIYPAGGGFGLSAAESAMSAQLIEAANKATQAHVGHAGSSGVAGHSVGEIYPYRISLFGWNQIRVHNPAGAVIAWTTYDRIEMGLEGKFRTFGEAFRDMEAFALNEKNDPMPADACRGNWFGANEADDANTTIDYIRWAKSIIAESEETCRIDTSEALDFLVAFVSEHEADDANTTIDYIRWAKSIIAESEGWTCRIDTSEALDFLVAFVSEHEADETDCTTPPSDPALYQEWLDQKFN